MTKGLRKGLTNYGDESFSLFHRKVFIKAMGYSDDALNRPIIGVTNTYSDYNPCHGNVPDLIESVKRGVQLAGGLPMVFPTISIHESFAFPTSMFLRNLMAMDTEEMIRAQAMDAVVQGDLRPPAERAQPPYIEQLARRAVGLEVSKRSRPCSRSPTR